MKTTGDAWNNNKRAAELTEAMGVVTTVKIVLVFLDLNLTGRTIHTQLSILTEVRDHTYTARSPRVDSDIRSDISP